MVSKEQSQKEKGGKRNSDCRIVVRGDGGLQHNSRKRGKRRAESRGKGQPRDPVTKGT